VISALFPSAARQVSLGALCVGALAVQAADPAPASPPAPGEVNLPSVVVIGSQDQLLSLPGAGDVLDAADLRDRGHADINRVLRQIPGVILREEDGHGLFPNLSLRAVDSGRSAKLTLMEDGVLTAPAPYSSPGAYYSPNVARMSGLEVLKGSSQVRFGPHSTGGVINYQSTPIPSLASGYLRSEFGTDHELRNHLYYGETVDTASGRFGYLLEYYDHRSDGFKTIDPAPDFSAREETGFRRQEPMLKLSWEPKTERFQRFELKLGHSLLEAQETYLGLTQADFDADPTRRYAGSRFDRIDTEMTRGYLRHDLEFSPALRLTTTVYGHEFSRNWFKDRSTGEDLADPAKLAVLKGEAAGELRYRNNDREYHARGAETLLRFEGESGGVSHRGEFGVRYHVDEESRFQRDDTFVQAANGAILERKLGVPGGGGNQEGQAEAIAVHLQDAIGLGALTLVPGLRYEHIEFEYTDFDTKGDPGKVTGSGSSSLDVLVPGLGLVLELSPQSSLFGGVHRGFSPPAPKSHAKDDVQEETSIGYEIGHRFQDGKALRSEVALYYTDFQDLVVPELIGAGGSGGGTENAGDVTSYGAEAKLTYDLGLANQWGIRNPWTVAVTYTHAELDSDTTSADDESIFSGGRKGNRIPYVPEVQLLVGTGVEAGGWGANVDLVYVDSTYSTASNASAAFDPSGTPNANFGKTDAHAVVDVSAFLRLNEKARLIGSVHNLFDEDYVVSLHPTGARPGRPLVALVGVEVNF
jgi:Fe(3+) dicitrate transport protein